MTLQKGFTDELNLKTAMPVLGQAASVNLDSSVLPSLNSNADFPLRLYASATPDAFLNLSASTTAMGDGGTKVSPPINGVGPASYVTGKINMGTGALTGLGTTTLNGSAFATGFTALTKTNGQYRRFVFTQQQDGSVAAVSSAEAASQGALTDYGSLAAQAGGSFQGYIDVIWVSAATQYKTPSASGNTIGNDGIFRVGGGGGGGSASAALALQSASTPNVTLTSGFLPLTDGRELASSDGGGTDTTNYGKSLSISATTVLAASSSSIGGGGSPANSTVYYLYIDLDTLASTPTTIASGSQTGRLFYPVVQANFAIGTTAPTSVNQGRYIYRGMLKTTSGGAWSGTGAELVAPTTLQGNNTPIAVSHVVYRLGKQTIGAIGTSTAGAGHVLSSKSFNPNIVSANRTWYSLASASDGSGNARTLTNTGSVVFTATGILGDSNAAASFGGANRLSSTDAAFNPSTSFAIALWAKPTGVSGTQTLAATQRVSGGSTTNFWLRMNTTTLEVLDSTGVVILSVPSAFAAGTWVHVGFRYDGTNGYAYINGKVEAGPIAFTPSAVTSPEFDLGANNPNGTPANFYTGVMDEVAFATGTMSDADILKLYSSRLDHNASVLSKNQEWTGNVYTDSDLAVQLPVAGSSGVLVDVSDSNSLFLDLSQYNMGTDSVELALKDTGLTPTVITPVPPYDVTYTSTPSSPVAHNQPDIPDVILLVETGTAGQWEQMATEGKILVDATNLTIDLSALSPAVGVSPNRVRIIARPARLASVGVPDATTARTGSVTAAAQTFGGKKTFNNGIVSAGINNSDFSSTTSGNTQAAKNAIINGDMQLSQRGSYTSATAAVNNAYWLDRWRTGFSTVTANKQQITTSQPSGLVNSKSAKIIATSTATGYLYHSQVIENFKYFAGKTITVSCYVKAHLTAGASGLVVRLDQTGVSPIVNAGYTTNDAWQLITATFTVDAAPSKMDLQIGVQNSSLTSSDFVEITQVMVNIGAVNSPFELAGGNEAGELAMAQRYCQVLGFDNSVSAGVFAIGQCGSGTSAYVVVALPVELRATPTLDSTVTSAASNFKVLTASFGSATCTALTLDSGSTPGAVALNITVASGLAAGNATVLTRVSTTGVIGLDAELT